VRGPRSTIYMVRARPLSYSISEYHDQTCPDTYSPRGRRRRRRAASVGRLRPALGGRVGRHSPTTMSTTTTMSMRSTTTTTTTTGTHHHRRVVPGARRRASAAHRRCATTTTRAAAAKPWGERDCRLVLEDGSVWPGRAFGAKKTMVGEVVFNTSLSGCARIARERPTERGRMNRSMGFDRFSKRGPGERARGGRERE